MTLKELRNSAGLTIRKVALKLNLDISSVCKWESGERKPLEKHRKKLAKLYGCSVEDIEQAVKETRGAK